MSKRNFILLITILTIIVGVALLYLYIKRPGGPNAPTDPNSFVSDFNPFGTSKDVTPTKNPDDTTDNPGTITTNPTDNNTTPLKLTKVSSMPVAGYTVYLKERYKAVPEVTPIVPESTNETPASTTQVSAKPTPTAPLTEFVPALRYVARTNGNIYQTFIDTIEERKFSSTIIPKVYEAFFGNKGESVTMRYLKADDRTITTFVGTLPKEVLGGDSVDNNEVKGVFLPDNITDLSVSLDTLKLFYLFNSGNTAVGISATLPGASKTQIFDSSFTEWLSQWPNTNMITLTTKPSAYVLGYMYSLDPVKKTFTKVLGGINGLTTLVSPSAKLILYGNNTLSLGVYNTETRETATLSVRGMPEKCVWAKTNDFLYCAIPKVIPTGTFPDDWYKGEATFSDSIWRIDVGTGNTQMILDPLTVSGGEDTDGIKLMLDDTNTNLFFVNKKDSYLWKLDLSS